MKITFDYTAVSVPTILRDRYDVEYASDEHKKLCDIADSFYNIGLNSLWGKLLEEYNELAEKYGRAFWELVMRDMHAIDEQAGGSDWAELMEDYNLWMLPELKKAIDK